MAWVYLVHNRMLKLYSASLLLHRWVNYRLWLFKLEVISVLICIDSEVFIFLRWRWWRRHTWIFLIFLINVLEWIFSRWRQLWLDNRVLSNRALRASTTTIFIIYLRRDIQLFWYKIVSLSFIKIIIMTSNLLTWHLLKLLNRFR